MPKLWLRTGAQLRWRCAAPAWQWRTLGCRCPSSLQVGAGWSSWGGRVRSGVCEGPRHPFTCPWSRQEAQVCYQAAADEQVESFACTLTSFPNPTQASAWVCSQMPLLDPWATATRHQDLAPGCPGTRCWWILKPWRSATATCASTWQVGCALGGLGRAVWHSSCAREVCAWFVVVSPGVPVPPLLGTTLVTLDDIFMVPPLAQTASSAPPPRHRPGLDCRQFHGHGARRRPAGGAGGGHCPRPRQPPAGTGGHGGGPAQGMVG